MRYCTGSARNEKVRDHILSILRPSFLASESAVYLTEQQVMDNVHQVVREWFDLTVEGLKLFVTAEFELTTFDQVRTVITRKNDLKLMEMIL